MVLAINSTSRGVAGAAAGPLGAAAHPGSSSATTSKRSSPPERLERILPVIQTSLSLWDIRDHRTL